MGKAQKLLSKVQWLPTWEAEACMRAVQPLPSWEAEGDVRELRRLPAWAAEAELFHMHWLQAREGAAKLQDVQGFEACSLSRSVINLSGGFWKGSCRRCACSDFWSPC